MEISKSHGTNSHSLVEIAPGTLQLYIQLYTVQLSYLSCDWGLLDFRSSKWLQLGSSPKYQEIVPGISSKVLIILIVWIQMSKPGDLIRASLLEHRRPSKCYQNAISLVATSTLLKSHQAGKVKYSQIIPLHMII